MALNDGLISYYKLDEASGTTAFDSVGTNDGAISGATWTTGKINDGLSFDGVNDYVDTNFGNTYTDSSYSLWFKSDITSGGDSDLVGQNYNGTYLNHNLTIRQDGSNSLFQLRTYNNSQTIKNKVLDYNWTSIDTNWHHIVSVKTGTSGKIYLDGVEVASSSDLWNVTNNNNFEIGRYNILDWYFDGLIDEVGIWNRALTQAEVTELYNSGAGLQYPFTAGGENGFLMKNF